MENVVDYTYSNLTTPQDILVKDDKIFVANFNGEDDYQILEFSTLDLSLTGNYGNYVNELSVLKGNFYGPRRFVAQMNEELTIIDDQYLDKIIQMDNINGDNWKTLPATGDGQDLFRFFSDPS